MGNSGKIKKQIMEELAELRRQNAKLEELENECRQREEELNNVFNLSMDILCIADIDGFFRKIKPDAEEVLGYSQE